MGDAEQLLPVVVGPTASGKSALALRLAEELNGEIVSADSVQIYRYFDIGSGKPSQAELARVPHHLLSTHEPEDEVDASRFAEAAEARVTEIRSRGKTPILCGGTFLWVRALVYGLAKAPPKDPNLRRQHVDFAAEHGRAALHAKLKPIDPESHERLQPNDLVRVSRALEVYELTGIALSEHHRQHGFQHQKHRVKYVGIRHTPDELTVRIRARVEQMFERGWLAEVETLHALGHGEARAMQSVGYRQVAAAVRSEETPDIPILIDNVTRATRVFARRQRTWLRDEPVAWLSPDDSLQVRSQDLGLGV